MKRLIITLLILCAGMYYAHGQAAVVTDPTSYAYFGQQLQQATTTIQIAEQQLSHLQKAKDRLEKINSAIKKISSYGKIIIQTQNTIESVNTCISELRKLNNLSPQIINKTVNKCLLLSQQVTATVADVTEALKPGSLNMSDKERLDMIDKTISELRGITLETDLLLRNTKKTEEMMKTIKAF